MPKKIFTKYCKSHFAKTWIWRDIFSKFKPNQPPFYQLYSRKYMKICFNTTHVRISYSGHRTFMMELIYLACQHYLSLNYSVSWILLINVLFLNFIWMLLINVYMFILFGLLTLHVLKLFSELDPLLINVLFLIFSSMSNNTRITKRQWMKNNLFLSELVKRYRGDCSDVLL